MDFSKISLAEETDESVTTRVRNSIKVALRERPLPEGGKAEIPCVIFSVNKGKGTGAQVVPLAEFEEYVTRLRHYADEGFTAAEAPKPYYEAHEMVDRTIGLEAPRDDDGNVIGDPDTVQWRVADGKGAKPAKVPLTAFTEVVEILESRLPKVQEILTALNAEAEEADAEGEDAGEDGDGEPQGNADDDANDAGDNDGEDAGDNAGE